ncbi:MAG: hypothetical protein PVH56_13765 [Desulfobacterales bacterium]
MITIPPKDSAMQTTNMPAGATGAVPPDNGEEPQRTGIPLSAAKKNFSKVSEWVDKNLVSQQPDSPEITCFIWYRKSF